jgi:heme/copper-type cytochrome/quinol oxidase subunit 1
MVLSAVLVVLAAASLAVAALTGDPEPAPGWTSYSPPSEDSGWTAYAPLEEPGGLRLGPWSGAAVAFLLAAVAVAGTAALGRRR